MIPPPPEAEVAAQSLVRAAARGSALAESWSGCGEMSARVAVTHQRADVGLRGSPPSCYLAVVRARSSGA
jgi:hypothetical protein